jgi:GAF domain-containing protein/sugar diacid utilization regulator
VSTITLEQESRHDATEHSMGSSAGDQPAQDRMRRALAAFSQVAAAVGDSRDLDELLHVVAGEVSALIGVDRCSIHLRDEASGIFRGYVAQSRGVCLGADIKRSLAGVPADGMTLELLDTRRPVIIANAQDDPRTVKRTVRFWKIRSIMAVPMLFADEVIGVIFLDDVDRPHVFTDEDADTATVFGSLAAVAVMHAQERIDLRTRLAAAHRKVKALRRATAVDERLSDLVLQGRSLQDLLDNLAGLLGKPCAVFGPDGERLATALPPGIHDGIAPRLLEPELARRPEVRDALAAHDSGRAFVVGPVPAAGILHRHVVAPVMLGSELWGRLVVMEHKGRFTGGDVVVLRRAATLIALQVNTERKAVEADWNAGSSLAAELLGDCSDATVVQRRADRLGVALDAPRVVMLIGSRSGNEDDVPSFRAVAAAFRRAAPDLTVHVTSVSGAVAALIEVPADVDPETFVASSDATFEAVREVLHPADQLVGGVSAVHVDRDGYRAGYQEARQVLGCIRRFSPDGGRAIFTADELGAGRLFLATSDGDLVTGFAEETFGGFVTDRSKIDLLATLCSFFDNMASIRRTAACLRLHENTIRYRLSRIEELTGLAVTHDPDAQLRARLCLLVLHLQGRLPLGATGVETSERRPTLEVVRAAS